MILPEFLFTFYLLELGLSFDRLIRFTAKSPLIIVKFEKGLEQMSIDTHVYTHDDEEFIYA